MVLVGSFYDIPFKSYDYKRVWLFLAFLYEDPLYCGVLAKLAFVINVRAL